MRGISRRCSHLAEPSELGDGGVERRSGHLVALDVERLQVLEGGHLAPRDVAAQGTGVPADREVGAPLGERGIVENAAEGGEGQKEREGGREGGRGGVGGWWGRREREAGRRREGGSTIAHSQSWI